MLMIVLTIGKNIANSRRCGSFLVLGDIMIYFIQAGENGPIKIGSSDDPERRMVDLQTANPYELKLLWVHKDENWSEEEIHKEFNHEKIRGEWYHPCGSIFEFIKNEMSNSYSITINNGDFYVITESFNGKPMDSFLEISAKVFTVFVQNKEHISIEGPVDVDANGTFVAFN